MSNNPFGLHTVTPYLMVADVRKLLTFVEAVFGATTRGEPSVRDDGTIKHAEVIIGDSVLMMGEPFGSIGSAAASLYIYVDDCDSTYAKALSVGATSVLPPDNYPHGDRYGGVKDESGTTWWVVTHVGSNE